MAFGPLVILSFLLLLLAPSRSASGQEDEEVIECTDPDEEVVISRVATSGESWAGTFTMKGQACNFNFLDATNVRHCYADRWILNMGGSTFLGQHMALLQLLSPCEAGFPCANTTQWLGEDVFEFAFDYAFLDLIVSAAGERLYVRIAELIHSFEGHELSVRGLIRAGNGFRKPGSVRVTFIRTRFFSDVLQDVTSAVTAYEGGPPPILHINIGRWYSYCMFSQVDWCPRDDLLADNGGPETDIAKAQIAEDEMRRMLAGLATIDIDLLVVEDDWQTSRTFDDVIAAVMREYSATHQRAVLLQADRVSFGNMDPAKFGTYDRHPINKLSHFLLTRFHSVACDKATNRSDLITFTTEGCDSEAFPEDQWFTHYVRPCATTVWNADERLVFELSDFYTDFGRADKWQPQSDTVVSGHIGEGVPYATFHTILTVLSVLFVLAGSFYHFFGDRLNAARVACCNCGASHGSHTGVTAGKEVREFDMPNTAAVFARDHLPPIKSAAVTGKAKQLDALGFARYLASVHVVCGHLWRKSPPMVMDLYVNDFGYTWVPWFMMLSGFILTYARANSSKPDTLKPFYIFTWERVKSIYPLYLVALLSSGAIKSYSQHRAFSLGGLFPSITSVLLLQAWFPPVTEHVLNNQCWFLSCIVPYWLLHNCTYRFARRRSPKQLLSLLTGISLLPWVLLLVLPASFGDVYWYQEHTWGATDEWVDWAVIAVKFSPLCYFHVYCFGVFLGALLPHIQQAPPPAVRYGASLGYFFMYLIFALSPWVPVPAAKLTFRLGVLLPLQGLSLMGLAIGQDPLAKLFALRPLRPLANLSYPQYLFQFVAFNIWSRYTGIGYWAFLVALSMAGYFFVQKPFNVRAVPGVSVWPSYARGGVVAALFPVGVWAIYALSGNREVYADTPATLRWTNGAVDSRLDLTSSGDEVAPLAGARGFAITGAAAGFDFINPSVVWDEAAQSLLVAARRHNYSRYVDHTPIDFFGVDNRNHTAVGTEVLQWYSDVAIGRLDSSLVLTGPMTMMRLAPEPWRPCVPNASYSKRNNTFTQHVSSGPEDPRFVRRGEQLWVSVYSLPPPTTGSGDAACSRAGRMFWAKMPSEPTEAVVARELAWEGSKDSVAEKNWMSFEHPSEGQLFMRSLLPWVVLRVPGPNEPLDAIGEDRADFAFRAEAPVLEATAGRRDVVFHGGTSALRVMPGDPLFLDGGDSARKPYYLAGFHTIDPHGLYINYLVEFAGEPPFGPERYSAALPLVEAPVKDGSIGAPLAFLSGLTATPTGQLLLSYGSSNHESRVLMLDKTALAFAFDNFR